MAAETPRSMVTSWSVGNRVDDLDQVASFPPHHGGRAMAKRWPMKACDRTSLQKVPCGYYRSKSVLTGPQVNARKAILVPHLRGIDCCESLTQIITRTIS